jgi:hypothetical protein
MEFRRGALLQDAYWPAPFAVDTKLPWCRSEAMWAQVP